jgi:hypothetical protein
MDRIRLITESENVRQTLAHSQGRLEQELRQAGNRPAEVAVELKQNNSGQHNNGQGFGQSDNSQLAGQNGNAGAAPQNRLNQDGENQASTDTNFTQPVLGESNARYA